MRKMLLGLVACLHLLNSESIFADSGCYPGPCPFSFRGFHIGGNVGVIGATSHTTDLDGLLAPTQGINHANFQHDNAVTAGIQIGYDWQFCHLMVLGALFDWNWTNVKNVSHFDVNFVAGLEETLKNQMHWFATLRGRVGLSFDDLLIYLTGGAAVSRFETNLRVHLPGIINAEPDFKDRRWGWTAGIGSEWGFCRKWSLNVEFLYLFFPTHKRSTTASFSGIPFTYHFDLFSTAIVGRVGINYRFCL